MNGCELIHCPEYKNFKCTNTQHFVDKYTGEEMCPRNDDAIPFEQYMGNMSYCRFEKTEQDFSGCLEDIMSMETIDDLSDSEKASAENLYKMAKEYINAFDNLGK